MLLAFDELGVQSRIATTIYCSFPRRTPSPTCIRIELDPNPTNFFYDKLMVNFIGSLNEARLAELGETIRCVGSRNDVGSTSVLRLFGHQQRSYDSNPLCRSKLTSPVPKVKRRKDTHEQRFPCQFAILNGTMACVEDQTESSGDRAKKVIGVVCYCS